MGTQEGNKRVGRLALVGGLLVSAVGLILFLGLTVVNCSSQGAVTTEGVCFVTHPLWPLAMLPFGLALVGVSFMHRFHNPIKPAMEP